jgi:hypothetical protein
MVQKAFLFFNWQLAKLFDIELNEIFQSWLYDVLQ